MGEDHFFLLFGLSVVWVASWIVASIFYRRSREKPIIPRPPDGSIFLEKRASGAWASNCLMVAVTMRELSITPSFPFNLMFLPEIYGSELKVDVSQIESVRLRQTMLGNNVEVDFGDRTVSLRLKRPNDFALALRKAGVVAVG